MGVLAISRPVDFLALHAAYPERYPCLLESVAEGGRSARFDILFACTGEHLLSDAAGQLHGQPAPSRGDFLAALADWTAASKWPETGAQQDTELPFLGGFVLALGYETAADIEPSLRLPAAVLGLPRALALRTPVALIRDRANGAVFLVSEPGHAALALRVQADLLDAPVPVATALPAIAAREDDPARFLRGVAQVIEHIAAGDVFQVNLSRAWRADWPAGASIAALYAALCANNPAPFAGLLQWGDFALLSSSPERLVRVADGWAETRPIAGTHARAETGADEQRRRDLIGHPKERAEHIMLIDLERNDLGRVCVPGSIEVDELMSIESYAHVHHIVSNVRGRLRAGIGPVEAIRAVFPGGTITGCPKVRCMQIIAALEGEGRGFYTGALGYLGNDGRMDLNILIRSLCVHGDELEFRAGAGIVADSIAERELAETRAKARGLLAALQLAPAR
ncbi:MAG: aminodeoxychorismate synthase component I [Lysobacterales bacterium]